MREHRVSTLTKLESTAISSEMQRCHSHQWKLLSITKMPRTQNDTGRTKTFREYGHVEGNRAGDRRSKQR